MRRRDFLRSASAGLAGAGVAGLATACAPPEGGTSPEGQAPAVHTGKKIQWRLASSFPRGSETIFGGAEVLADHLEAMSEGRFRIRPYPAGELVPGLQVLDAIQQGTVQVGHTVSYYFTGKNPALAFDACVPFGLTSRQQTAWLTEGGGLELLRPLFADFNVINFPGGNTGSQMGGWFKREIGGPQDLNGLKMRIPGLGGQVMARLGVTVQVLAGGDIFPALERGAIDATEWVGPYDDEKLGFHKIARYYYYPGWWEPGPSLSFLVNLDAWNSLPAAYQEMFQAAAAQAALVMQARYDALNPAALQRLLAAGTQLRRFSPELMEAAREASLDMLEADAARDPGTYGKILTAWKKARADMYQWFGTAELAYDSFAFPTESSRR